MTRDEKLARRIAETCLALKPGERVDLSGGVRQFGLLARIAVHARRLGAYPHISVRSEDLSFRMLTEVPEEILLAPPTPHEEYMARLYDAELLIDSSEDPGRFAAVPPALMAKLAVRGKRVQEISLARGTRVIPMAWPSAARARRAGMELPAFRSLFWNALDFDLDAMLAVSTPLRERLSRARRGRLTSRKGTDLTFALGGRRVMVDAGHFTDEMLAEGDRVKNLPCGEVYTTLHEDSAEGVVVFDEVFLRGTKIPNLRCRFKKGRLIDSSADRHHDVFRSMLETATGDRDRIGEFAIGTNPALTRAIGDTLLDEKIFGSVHLALGEDRSYGGTNQSSIHWDFVVLKPTVELDGNVVLREGRFAVADR